MFHQTHVIWVCRCLGEPTDSATMIPDLYMQAPYGNSTSLGRYSFADSSIVPRPESFSLSNGAPVFNVLARPIEKTS